MLHYYIGRQPIYDSKLSVIGYELLYRSHETLSANPQDGDAATSEVLYNSFMEIGLNELVGRHKAFVNLTRNFILNSTLIPPVNERLVLEILEDIEVDEEIVRGIALLKEKGYVIALDDFIYHEKMLPLIRLADIIKIDILAISREELREYVTSLRTFSVQLLAEKVETYEEFETCKSLGFDYYQGFFLSRPKTLKGRRIPVNHLSTLQMLAKLQDPNIAIKELEQLISQDITLSYRLLRYINSAAFSLRNKIESIHHAIVFLGLNEIKNWASLMALTKVDDKPNELFVTALIRAKMCELFADHSGAGNKGTAFITGLFSSLETIMDAPMEKLLESIPVAVEISEALLNQEGVYAEILQLALAYERGQWEEIQCPEEYRHVLPDLYREAVKWSMDAEQLLAGDANQAPRQARLK